MWRKFVAHPFAPRIRDEGLHEKPIELIAAYQSAKVALQGKRRHESFTSPLVAVRQGPFFFLPVVLSFSAKIERHFIREAKLLDIPEKNGLLICANNRKMGGCRVQMIFEVFHWHQYRQRQRCRRPPSKGLHHPKLVVLHAIHNLASNRCRSAVGSTG